MKEQPLGMLAGLRITVIRSAVFGTIAVYGIAVGLMALASIPIGSALLGGVIIVILHWFSELLHQLGHAWAARRTGYPMIGIRFGALWVFSTSLYPPDEPALPARIHIRRALGGPLYSAGLSALAFIIILLSFGSANALWLFVLWFFFLENLFVMSLQVFIPLGFNDGGTLWHWLRQRKSI
jgi:hypothetical protein